MIHLVFATFFLHQKMFAFDDDEHVYSIVLDGFHMLEYQQSFQHYNSSYGILPHASVHDKHKKIHLLSLQVLRCSCHKHNAVRVYKCHLQQPLWYMTHLDHPFLDQYQKLYALHFVLLVQQPQQLNLHYLQLMQEHSDFHLYQQVQQDHLQ